MLQSRLVPTPWGMFGFVARDGRLVATYLPRRLSELRRTIAASWPGSTPDDRLLSRFRDEVADYFAGKVVRFSPPIDLSDFPAFQSRVFEACRRIAHGHTASYSDLARAVGNPRAVRAVGGAMAANRLPLVIPCHRVLRADGAIGGFSSRRGIAEKMRLLRLEGLRFDGRGRQRPAARDEPGGERDVSIGSAGRRRAVEWAS